MKIFAPFVVTCAVILSAKAAHGQTLSDLVLFRATSAGASIGEGWNTRAGDFTYNLYLRQGSTWINSGNAATTSISIDLSAPGVYTYEYFADTGAGQTGTTILGLNMFFNGSSTTPLISALGTQGGTFSANSNSNTAQPSFANTPGSGTLSTTFGAISIELTNFTVITTQSTVDRVQPYNNIAGNANDTHGILEITVRAIPTPGTAALLGLGTLMAARRRR